MSSWYKTMGMFVVAGLLTLAVAGQVAFAQEDGADRGNRPGQQQGDHGQRPEQPLRGIIDREAIKSVIAETLGMTVEELDAAREAGTTLEEVAEQQGVAIEAVQTAAKAAAVAQVNQAVTDGEITQEQADALIERINSSEFPLGEHGRDGGHGRPGNPLRGIIDHEAIKGVVAQTLGLTVEELDAAHEAGTTLEALAEQQGVALENVQAAAKAAAIAQVNQAVTDGTITQEQADTLIERINNRDFPLRGPRSHGDHETGTDGTDSGSRDTADSTVTADAENAAAQGDTAVAMQVFLPVVTR